MLFGNDFVLAKVLPIGTVLNNTTTAITKANVVHALYLFAMLLTYWFSSPQVVFLRYFTTLAKNLGESADIFHLHYNRTDTHSIKCPHVEGITYIRF